MFSRLVCRQTGRGPSLTFRDPELSTVRSGFGVSDGSQPLTPQRSLCPLTTLTGAVRLIPAFSYHLESNITRGRGARVTHKSQRDVNTEGEEIKTGRIQMLLEKVKQCDEPDEDAASYVALMDSKAGRDNQHQALPRGSVS